MSIASDVASRAVSSPEQTRAGGTRPVARVLACIFVCLVLIAGLAASWRSGGSTQDEGLLLEYPMLIVHGKLPFRDYQSSYGIGSYLPLAGAYELLGPSVSVERSAGVAYRVAVVLALMALIAPLGLPVLLAGGSMAAVGILGPGPPVAYGWYAALAAVLWSIWLARWALLDPRRRARLVWAGSGLLAGVAFSIRPDIGLVGCAAVLVLAIPAARRYGAWLVGGIALGALPAIVDFALAGLPATWTYLVQSRLHTLPEGGQVFTGRTVALSAALVLAVAIIVAAAIRTRRIEGPGPITRCWLVLAAIDVALLGQAFQRPDAGHFAFVAAPILGLLPWAVNCVVKLRTPTAIAIPLACTIAVAAHALVYPQPGFVVRNGDRSFPVAAATDRAGLQAVVGYLDRHVGRGRSLFVGPRDLRWALAEDTAVYYLIPWLRPSSFYLELGPGDNSGVFTSHTLAALTRSDVLVLHAQTAAQDRAVYPYARPGSAAPNRLIARDFRAVFRVGAYSVWLRRRGALAADGNVG